MPQLVDLPNGDVAEFPDEFSPEQIQSTLRRQFSPQPKAEDFPSAQLQPTLEPMMVGRLPSVPTQPFQSPTQEPPAYGQPQGFPSAERVARDTAEVERVLHASPVPDFPEGRTITEKTGLPRPLAVPVSSVGKLGSGIAQFFTSPQGATEAAAGATPAAPIMLLKWGYDMLKSAKDSLGDLTHIPEEAFHQYVADQMRQNIQGSPLPDEYKQDFYQRGADDLVNLVALGLGGAKAGKEGLKGIVESPAKMRERAKSLGIESELLDFAEGVENKPLPDSDVAASIRLGLPPRGAPPEPIAQTELTKELVNRAVAGVTAPHGRQRLQQFEQPLQELRNQELIPVREITTQRPEFRPGGGRPVAGKLSFDRPAEDVSRAVDETQQFPEPATPAAKPEVQTVENRKPLRSVSEILKDKLAARDFVGAVDELSKQPVEAQRKLVDEAIGVSRGKVPLKAAEMTIFNELWDKVYQESLSAHGKPTAPPAKPFFDRGSEAEGLGRQSTAPTIEDIRAQRAAEAKAKLPQIRPGDTAIKIEQPDGTVIEAVTNGKEWEVGDTKIPNVGRAVDIGNGKVLWSDGPLRPGEKIISAETQGARGGVEEKLTTEAPASEVKVPSTVPEPTSLSGEQVQATPRVKSTASKMKWGNPQSQGAALGFGLRMDTATTEIGNYTVRPLMGENSGKWTANLIKRDGTTENIGLFRNISEAKRAAESKESELNSGRQSLADKAISGIESLQKKIRGKGELQMGVPSAILDTALEAARLSLKAGKSVAEAIEAALAHIRRNIQKGKWDENKVRALFESELGGAASSPASADKLLGNDTANRAIPSVQPATRPQSQPVEATLGKIAKVFEPAPKQTTPIKTKAVNVVESLRTGISSKFRPVNKLAEDVAKAYGLSKPKDIAGIMEQLKGSQGKGEADIYRFDRDVSDLVKGDEKAFSEYMFTRRALDRLRQDQKDIANAIAGEDVPVLNRRNVGDFTINELEPALKAMEEKLGPEKLKNFEQAASEYQRYMDEALKLQVESGRMSREIYDAIKSGNEFYAPFKVMKYLEETSKPQGTGKKIDTVADFTKAMSGITDPNFKLGDMLGAARQSILLSRILADKNMAMRHVAALAPFDVEGRFIKKLAPDADAPAGMEAVNVLENGKQVRYAVNPDVAQAIQLYGGKAGGIMLRVASAFAIPFRAGATALNIPFQVSNLLADQPRAALISKYGLQGVSDLWRYPSDFVQSLYSSITGDVFGSKNQLFLDFLDSGVAGGTAQEFYTPEALKFKEPTTISRSKKLASTVLNVIPDFAKAIEQTSKIMGVKRAIRFEKVVNADTGKLESIGSGKALAQQIPEAITELRRFSGSPDFGRMGKTVEATHLNLLYMFLNARIQGTIADVGRLTGRDGGKASATAWMRIAAAVGIPTAYLYYLNNQSENKADYDARPDQEKQNYWLIPKVGEDGKPRYITTDEGEKVRDYWRVPKRESSKWMANLTESALNFAEKRDPKAAKDFGAQMLQEISPVNIQGDTAQEKLESVASSLTPVAKLPLELGTGRDLYRHRPLMSEQLAKASPEQQYTERTPEAFKKLAVLMPDVMPEVLRSPVMLENMTRNLTAGLLTQFMSRKPVKGRSELENTPLLQRFQSLPMTDTKDFQEGIQGLERMAADEQLAKHREALKLMEDNPKLDLQGIVDKAMAGKQDFTRQDIALFKHITDLWVAKENGATFRERQLIGLPARQRALWVQQQLAGLTPDKQEQKIEELARKRVFTESVAAELAALMAGQEKP